MASPSGSDSAKPTRRLRLFDAIALTVGVVVGAGIFRAPSVVAAGVDSELALLGVWGLGGLFSLIGALCYAELVCAFPSAGGEYHFIDRAFGRKLAFLFGWARLTVTCTGSIAILAYIFGDYAATLVPLGQHGSTLLGAAVVALLTAINACGLRFGTLVQNIFTALVVTALLAIAIAGLATRGAPAEVVTAPESGAFGLAMVFVLLTYGGWNEAAYLSAEIRGGRRRMAAVVVIGVGAVTALYLLINAAYVRVLGIEGLRASTTVGADVVGAIVGPTGARAVALVIAAAAMTSINATIVTGSRAAYALGRDFRVLRGLGRWDDRASAPVTALWVQGGLAIILIGLGAFSRSGFETMVEYTAPVFWGFFLLTGLALFVLRRREPDAPRPFRVPLYPLTPIIFCAISAWLLHASLAYTQVGAMVGVVVLALGALPLWLESIRKRTEAQETS